MWRLLRSMRFKIVLLVSVMMLCLMAFSLLFFHFTFSDYLKRSGNESLEALVTQTAQTLDYSFSMLENTMTYFFSNRTLIEWFSDENVKTADAAGKLVLKIQLDESLRHTLMLNSAWQNNLMDSAFFIVDKRCFSFYSQSKLPMTELTRNCFAVFDDLDGATVTGVRTYPPMRGEPLFYPAKRYPEADSPLSLTLILCVDEDTLLAGYEKALQYPGTVACIVDADGMIYSSADKSQLGARAGDLVRALMGAGEFGAMTIGADAYYAHCQPISTSGLSFVVGVPQRSLIQYAQSVSYRFVGVMLLAFCAFLVVTILVSYRSTRFLDRVISSMRQLKQGDFKSRMPESSTTEIAELNGTFNEMADKIDYLIHEVYEKQLAMKRADIRYLQSQIHPHFLFNALAVISTKAKLTNQDTIYNMTHALGTLLEAAMNDSLEGMIPVSEELEYIRCYLYIQKQRFGDRLDYEIDVRDGALNDARVPRLCVEPIVENAVIHGLETKPSHGRVSIRVMGEGCDLLFVITDDGVGFPKDKPPRAAEGGRARHEPIGLTNTDRRLKLIYGDRYGVFIDEDQRVGARVTVRIPRQTGGDAHGSGADR